MKKLFVMVMLVGVTILGAQRGWSADQFVVDVDGTVMDRISGLTWMKNANCWGELAWEEAIKAIDDLNAGRKSCADYTGKLTDWHLPSKSELITLVRNTNSESGLILAHPNPFVMAQQGHYWSATDAEPGSAWYLNLHNGHLDHYGKQTSYFVWPVRGRLITQ